MLDFQTPEGPVGIAPSALIIAGWTGRNASAVQHHIDELAAIGVPAPSTVPLYYRASVQQLTQGGAIEVVGAQTSGEAEPVIVCVDGRFLLTVGSDHTDRALEAHSVALSKQIAAKPVGRTAVWLDTVNDPDSLTLRAFVGDEAGAATPYQDGTFASIRPLMDLVSGARDALGAFGHGTVMFCGTVPTIGGAVRPSRFFTGTIGGAGAALTVSYETLVLPVVA